MHRMNFSIESRPVAEPSRFPWLATLALTAASFFVSWVALGWVQ